MAPCSSVVIAGFCRPFGDLLERAGRQGRVCGRWSVGTQHWPDGWKSEDELDCGRHNDEQDEPGRRHCLSIIESRTMAQPTDLLYGQPAVERAFDAMIIGRCHGGISSHTQLHVVADNCSILACHPLQFAGCAAALISAIMHRESKGELTDRPRREGRWEAFVERREELKAEGTPAKQGWFQAAVEFPASNGNGSNARHQPLISPR